MGKCEKCDQSATLTCTNCKLVFYCSRECQKGDWKIHKEKCKPFNIETSDFAGRCLKLSRDVSTGSVILAENPILIGPKWTLDEAEENYTFSCVGCFEAIRTLHYKCLSCNWPACSPECVGLSNKELHDVECQFLKLGKGPKDKTNIESIKNYYRMDIFMALKAILYQRKFPKRFNTIMQMESNEKKRLLSTNYRESEEKINFIEENFFEPLKSFEENAKQVLLPVKDKKTLHKIFGILETNAIYISLPTGTEICGIYPTASLLQHSCLPNVSYQFDMKNSFKITVVAGTDIKSGTEITTSYTQVIWPTFMRQQHLQQTKYFECNCMRCCDPTELGTNFGSLRCIGTDENACNGLQLPTNPNSLEKTEWTCRKCKVQVSLEHVNFLVNRMNEEIDNALASDPSAKDLEDLIEKLNPFLHPNHYLFFNLKHSLMQIYGNKGSTHNTLSDSILQRKFNMCEELLQITNVLDPFYIRIRFYVSIILYEKAQCLIEMGKRKLFDFNDAQIKSCLDEAKRIISTEVDTLEGKQLTQKIENILITL